LTAKHFFLPKPGDENKKTSYVKQRRRTAKDGNSQSGLRHVSEFHPPSIRLVQKFSRFQKHHGRSGRFNLYLAPNLLISSMSTLSYNDKLILLQFAIDKYDSENMLKEKLKDVLSTKDIERGIDTLIGTQKVKRIGPDTLQNNISHTGGLPHMPEGLQEIVDGL
jgi:hypothetical protein